MISDDTPLNAIEWSVRTANALMNNGGYRTVGEVRSKPDHELLRTPNFGRKSLRELRETIGGPPPRPPVQRQPDETGVKEIDRLYPGFPAKAPIFARIARLALYKTWFWQSKVSHDTAAVRYLVARGALIPGREPGYRDVLAPTLTLSADHEQAFSLCLDDYSANYVVDFGERIKEAFARDDSSRASKSLYPIAWNVLCRGAKCTDSAAAFGLTATSGTIKAKRFWRREGFSDLREAQKHALIPSVAIPDITAFMESRPELDVVSVTLSTRPEGPNIKQLAGRVRPLLRELLELCELIDNA